MKIHLLCAILGAGLVLGIAQAKPRGEQRKAAGSRQHEMTNRMGRHHERQVGHHSDEGQEADQQRRTKWGKRAGEKSYDRSQEALLRDEHFLQVNTRKPGAPPANEGRAPEAGNLAPRRGAAEGSKRQGAQTEGPVMLRGSIIKGKAVGATKRGGGGPRQEGKQKKKANKKAVNVSRKRKPRDGHKLQQKKKENSKVFVKPDHKAARGEKVKKDATGARKAGKKGNKHMWKKAARRALRYHREEKGSKKKGEGKFEKVVSKKMKERKAAKKQ